MQYKAFISYKHHINTQFAIQLESDLKRYAKPLLKPPIKIFRDEKHLAPGVDLPELIRNALNDSEYFLVLASQEAAESSWVQDEILHWCKTLRRTEKLIIVLVKDKIEVDSESKTIDWNNTNALPTILKEQISSVPLYVDLSWIKTSSDQSTENPDYKKAINSLVARFRNLDPNDMLGEEVRQHKKTRTLIFSAVTALVVFAIAAIIGAYFATQQANRARANAIVRVASSLVSGAKPTLGALVLTELPDEAEPDGGVRTAQQLAAMPVSPSILQGHTESLYHAAFSPDGQYVVTASFDKTARLWRADGTGVPITLQGHTGSVVHAAFSPDGQYVVTASFDKTARLWRADGTGEPITLQGHTEGLYHAAFSPDGQYVVTASIDMTARLWRADGTGEPITLQGHTDRVVLAAFSPDGQYVVTASFDKTARLWRADGTGEPITLQGHTDRVLLAAFSPDGQHVVTASRDKTARIWRADGTGKPVILRGHTDIVRHAAFSPDCQYVVTASFDKTARLWRADGTGVPITLQGHTDIVKQAAFSPDGQYVVTASFDKTARLWRADGTGVPITLQGHTSSVVHAAFSPDGQYVVTASSDKTARVWQISWRGLISDLRGVTNACLTSDQRVRFLGESYSDALDANSKCERRYGREPKS